MNRKESAQLVKNYVNRVVQTPVGTAEFARDQRILGELGGRMVASADKYEVSPSVQSFEVSTPGVMLYGLREELLDGLNYCAMADHLLAQAGKGVTDISRWSLETTAYSLFCCIIRLDREMERLGHIDDRDYITQLEEQSGGSHREG